MQPLILRHDFEVYIRQLQINSICNITLPHQLILHHYFQCKFLLLAELLSYIHVRSYICIRSYTHMRQNIDNKSNSYYQYPKINHVGGGSKFFSI